MFLNRLSLRRFYFYSVGLVTLFCFTFSQKIPNVAQEWPFLYSGLILVLISAVISTLKFFLRSRLPRFSLEPLAIFGFLTIYICISGIQDERALKDFTISLFTGPIFVLSLLAYNKGRVFTNIFIHDLCVVLVAFSVLVSLVAWMFFFGSEFFIGNQEYFHRQVWGYRLHGIAGEPAHFGAIVSIGFLCSMYLHTESHVNLNLLKTILFVFLGFSVIFSGTRNAILSLLISFTVFTTKNKSVSIKKIAIFLVSIVFGFCVLIYVYPEILFILKDNLRIGDDLSQRFRMAKAVNFINMMYSASLMDIFFGKGLAFIVSEPSYMNEYMELTAGFGATWMVGVFFFLIIILRRYLFMIKQNKEIASFGLSLLVYCLSFFVFYAPVFKVFHITSFALYVSIFLAIFYRPRAGYNYEISDRTYIQKETNNANLLQKQNCVSTKTA